MTAQDNMQDINKEIEVAIKKASVSTQTEEVLQNLLLVLEQTGLLDDASKEVLKERLFEDFYLSLMTELLSNITEEQKNSVINAKQTGLQDIQILELQFQLYKKNTGRDIEEYAEQLYNEMAERVLKELDILRQSTSDIEKLSDDQVRILDNMIEEGNEDAVLEKLNSFLGSTGNQEQSTPTSDDSKYSHIIALVKEGKLQEAKDEINKVIVQG